MTSAQAFDADYNALLSRIYAESPSTRVLVLPLPQAMLQLESVMQNQSSQLLGACTNVWAQYQICHNLTAPSDSDKPVVADRLNSFNTSIKNAVTAHAAEGQDIRLAAGIESITFKPTDIDFDCFHPSPDGLNKIANSAWASTWWAQQ